MNRRSAMSVAFAMVTGSMTVFAGAPTATAGNGDSCQILVDGVPQSPTVSIDQAFFDGIVEPFETIGDFGDYYFGSAINSPELWDPETLFFDTDTIPDTVTFSLGDLSTTESDPDQIGALPEAAPSGMVMVFGLVALFLAFGDMDEEFLAAASDASSYPLEIEFSFGASGEPNCVLRFEAPNTRSRNPIDLDHYLDRAEADALPNTR
jgi:hypothetical protein